MPVLHIAHIQRHFHGGHIFSWCLYTRRAYNYMYLYIHICRIKERSKKYIIIILDIFFYTYVHKYMRWLYESEEMKRTEQFNLLHLIIIAHKYRNWYSLMRTCVFYWLKYTSRTYKYLKVHIFLINITLRYLFKNISTRSVELFLNADWTWFSSH